MSIEPEQPPSQSPRSEFISGVLQAPSDPKDDQVAALESKIQALENKHSENFFIWALVVLILFDALILPSSQNWAAPAVIGMIEAVAILALAIRCKVDFVLPLIDKLLGAYSAKNGKQS